ncbi:hypothetical protein ACFVFI_04425 [Streptomyces sp. NPDC057705]|uniref:hypothetical protein n=1 Tax=Streptomyces sp. NPDC057705 TaxID=3346222 RepID=UPI0036A0897F
MHTDPAPDPEPDPDPVGATGATPVPSGERPRRAAPAGRTAEAGTAAGDLVVPLLALVLVLLVLVIGAGLLYVATTRPELTAPLSVAAQGIAAVVSAVGVLAALAAVRRR